MQFIRRGFFFVEEISLDKGWVFGSNHLLHSFPWSVIHSHSHHRLLSLTSVAAFILMQLRHSYQNVGSAYLPRYSFTIQ